MQHQTHNPLTVAILGGDPVVGRTLELMLNGAGYDARFLNGAFIDRPAELPEAVRVVILAPGLHPKAREGFLNGMKSALATAKIAVLELVRASDRALDHRRGSVLWPCRIQDLKQEIEAALPISSGVG